MKATNRMISRLFIAAVLSVVVSAFGDETNAASAKVKASAAVRRRPRNPRQTGGFLMKEITGKIIAVRNAQKIIPTPVLETAVDYARRTTYLPVVLVGGDEKKDNVAVEVTLVDALRREGQTVLVAPEQHCAELATGWLVADDPADETRAARVKAELTRAVLMSLGCGISPFQPDLMCEVQNLKMLDRLDRANVGPAVRSVYEETRQRLDMEKVVIASYRQACQQGWAPEPTNDVQKAIWKEVHELPSEPIKIKFDPKRDAGK